jgi:acetoin utilization deacetylase AcuC-like enzyme
MPGTNDKAYIGELERWLLPLFDAHQPDFVVYVGGADPYRDDQLGSLALTKEGLSLRDALIVEACKERDLPLLVVLAGGYAHRFEDTVAIHVETLRQARRLWRSS